MRTYIKFSYNSNAPQYHKTDFFLENTFTIKLHTKIQEIGIYYVFNVYI
jgi:hypothetical protein